MANPVPPAAAGAAPAPTPDAPKSDPAGGVSIIYAWDALCGWCFGFIPAMRHLTSVLPQVPVALLPGGLISGDRVAPYAAQIDYIRDASARMEARTGQAPAMPFWDLIGEPDSPLATSAPPTLAVLRMQAASPATTLDFAHCLQEAHFLHGHDLNAPGTYADILARYAMPEIDTDDLDQASDATPQVAAAYAQASELGLTSYPTLLVVRDGVELGRLSGIYDGPHLAEAVRALL